MGTIFRSMLAACIGLLGLLVGTGVDAQQQETFNTQPPPLRSRFSCSGRKAGYYADAESNCRAYHTCDEHGNHFTHYCPEDTAFRQDAMICDHAYQVDCAAGTTHTSIGFGVGGQINNALLNEPRGESSNGFVSSFRPEAVTSSTMERREVVDVEDGGGFQGVTFPRRDGGHQLRTTAATGPQQRVDTNLPNRKTNPPTTSRITPPPRTFFTPSTPPPTPTISLDLLPPAESPIDPHQDPHGFEPEDDEYSFLAPPPIRTDNDFLRLTNPTSIPTPTPPVTQAQPSRSRSLDPSPIPIKPSHLLEPPHLDSNPVPESSRPSNRADAYAYAETLRSIQSSSSTEAPFTRTTPTTTTTTSRAEIFGVPPVVLLPPENPDSEVDPYYPKEEGSTEAYFTPSGRPLFGTTMPTRRRPLQQHHQQGTASKFQVPPVLPDLNSLDDLLDRRKLFFIPTLKAGA